MKKFFLIFAIFLLTSCNTATNTPTTETGATQEVATINETQKFITEYESLNDGTRPTVKIPAGITVDVLESSDVKNTLDNGSGIVFFGFPTCPWCRHMLPNLFDAMQETGVTNLQYLNVKDIRNSLKTESGAIITENPGTPEYAYILEKMHEILPEYKDLGNPDLKRMYVPFVIVMKDGKILSHHLSTLDDQTDSKTPLTDEQKLRLKNIFVEMITPIKPTGGLLGEPCDTKEEEKEAC